MGDTLAAQGKMVLQLTKPYLLTHFNKHLCGIFLGQWPDVILKKYDHNSFSFKLNANK